MNRASFGLVITKKGGKSEKFRCVLPLRDEETIPSPKSGYASVPPPGEELAMSELIRTDVARS